MLKRINDNYENITECIDLCLQGNFNYLGYTISSGVHKDMFRSKFNDNQEVFPQEMKVNEPLPTIEEEVIRVKLLCNWTSTKDITKQWSKMSQDQGRWNNIQLVTDETPDYWIIVNRPPPNEHFIPKKTIVIQMEPHMDINQSQWGEWSHPDTNKFLAVLAHKTGYNNIEWHLSWTYSDLVNTPIDKTVTDRVSTVLSAKYQDPGQKLRIDFSKYLDHHGLLDVFGSNKCGYKSYKGPLPYHCKDNAMFPYKYVFNAENNSIPNYFTEKIVDGILAECLVFYWGCPNLEEYVDQRCFVRLPLEDVEASTLIIKQAIAEDWWSQRIGIIRKEKNRILKELQFFPRIEAILEWN
jgi:hypothetical protein